MLSSRSFRTAMLAPSLLLGLALFALPDVSSARSAPSTRPSQVTPPADARDNNKQQGQAGDLCSTDQDCQRSPARLRCVSESNQKVCRAIRPIPVPT